MNPTPRELRPYLKSRPGAAAGSHGKRGYLRMGFELDDRGRSILRDLERRTPLIVQQELYFDEAMPEMPCVYILSSGGPNVDGDRYEQHFSAGPGACAHISTGAATKLAEMRCDCSALTQTFTLGEDAYMEYLSEPVIPCRNTRFVADTLITVHPSATLFYAETYLGGRKYFGAGERFDYDLLSVRLRARREDHEPLFCEKFVIQPRQLTPDRPGAMNGFDVFAEAVVLTPQQHADALYASTPAYLDRQTGLAAGISRLPNRCGVIFKVLGRESEPVKRIVREFCSAVRLQVRGRPLFDEFPWR